MANTTLSNMNDNQLSQYLYKANLRLIQALLDVSTRTIGSKDFRTSFIQKQSIERVYGKAVREAISRGIIITH